MTPPNKETRERRQGRPGRIPEPEYDEKEAHREHDATDVWEPR